jgi:DNA-directed RNA polymerase specialized sigma24 family protein
MTQDQISQMILDNADAIRAGVVRVASQLAEDVIADLVADATLALLDTRGASFDATRGNAATFCRMVAYQFTTDRVRAMKRGGQFSGAYAGFGNADLDAGNELAEGEGGDVRRASARDMHKAPIGADAAESPANCVRVSGMAIQPVQESPADVIADRDWNAKARAIVAGVLPSLSAEDQALWAELASGDWDAAEYGARVGIATATAHVRANRLRAKVRGLVAQAA